MVGTSRRCDGVKAFIVILGVLLTCLLLCLLTSLFLEAREVILQ